MASSVSLLYCRFGLSLVSPFSFNQWAISLSPFISRAAAVSCIEHYDIIYILRTHDLELGLCLISYSLVFPVFDGIQVSSVGCLFYLKFEFRCGGFVFLIISRNFTCIFEIKIHTHSHTIKQNKIAFVWGEETPQSNHIIKLSIILVFGFRCRCEFLIEFLILYIESFTISLIFYTIFFFVRSFWFCWNF